MPYSFEYPVRIALALIALSTEPVLAATIHSVGSVTWHPEGFVGKTVEMRAYVLAIAGSMILLSDEARGPISEHDLPVRGVGVDHLALSKRYLLTGVFMKEVSPAANGSSYRLELTAEPRLLVP